MENTQFELVVIEKTVAEVTRAKTQELNELQLALVGGGFGDTVL